MHLFLFFLYLNIHFWTFSFHLLDVSTHWFEQLSLTEMFFHDSFAFELIIWIILIKSMEKEKL